MIRRTASILGAATLVLTLLSGCSSDSGSSGSGGSTSTTLDPQKQQQETNLATWASDVEQHEPISGGAAYDSVASRYAQWVADYDVDRTVTVRDLGDVWQVCGVGQPENGCAELSNFTFSGGNQVQSFDYDGQPITGLLHGAGANAEFSTGEIASVAFREAFYSPKDRQLYVSMSVLWDPEGRPDTNGCDPTMATYSKGGPPADPRGGGQGSDGSLVWLMTVRFPDASLGGELKVPCFRQDGSSEIFTILIPG